MADGTLGLGFATSAEPWHHEGDLEGDPVALVVKAGDGKWELWSAEEGLVDNFTTRKAAREEAQRRFGGGR